MVDHNFWNVRYVYVAEPFNRVLCFCGRKRSDSLGHNVNDPTVNLRQILYRCRHDTLKLQTPLRFGADPFKRMVNNR